MRAARADLRAKPLRRAVVSHYRELPQWLALVLSCGHRVPHQHNVGQRIPKTGGCRLCGELRRSSRDK